MMQIFLETHYHAQSQPFNLVTLDCRSTGIFAGLDELHQCEERVSGPAQQVVPNLVSRCHHQQRFSPLHAFIVRPQ